MMSENVRPKVKTTQTKLNILVPQPLEKLVASAWSKLKNILSQENTLTGIQFYGEMDE